MKPSLFDHYFFGHACFWISAIKKRVFSSMQKNSCYNAAGSYLFKVKYKNGTGQY